MSSAITILTGSLSRDVEMRYTPSGQAVSTLNIPVNSQYKDKNTGEMVKRTKWFRVEAWGKLAENCNNMLRKGSVVSVQGELKEDPATGAPRIWTDNSGSARTSFELRAFNVDFLANYGAQGQDQQLAQSQGGYGQPNAAMTPPPDTEIPF